MCTIKMIHSFICLAATSLGPQPLPPSVLRCAASFANAKFMFGSGVVWFTFTSCKCLLMIPFHGSAYAYIIHVFIMFI